MGHSKRNLISCDFKCLWHEFCGWLPLGKPNSHDMERVDVRVRRQSFTRRPKPAICHKFPGLHALHAIGFWPLRRRVCATSQALRFESEAVSTPECENNCFACDVLMSMLDLHGF
eukprot:6045739-Lingulodinium_polyedra.AAC.1